MRDDDFLPNGHDNVSFGRMNIETSVLRGITLEGLQDILRALDCTTDQYIEDDSEEIYLKCNVGGLSFSATLLDDDETTLTQMDSAGNEIYFQSAYELSIAEGINLDLFDLVNNWNRSEFKTRATTDGHAIFLDYLIPCDGVDSGLLSSSILDWFYLNREFIDFSINLSTKQKDDNGSTSEK